MARLVDDKVALITGAGSGIGRRRRSRSRVRARGRRRHRSRRGHETVDLIQWRAWTRSSCL
jgi:NADP-dependent 3-hydroxy acid dehydrogenase YdfG